LETFSRRTTLSHSVLSLFIAQRNPVGQFDPQRKCDFSRYVTAVPARPPEKVAWHPVPVSKDQCPIFGITYCTGSTLWTVQSVFGLRGIVACHFSVMPVGNRSGPLTARFAPAAEAPSGLQLRSPIAPVIFVVTAGNHPRPLIARVPRMPTKGCWHTPFTCSNIASAPPWPLRWLT